MNGDHSDRLAQVKLGTLKHVRDFSHLGSIFPFLQKSSALFLLVKNLPTPSDYQRESKQGIKGFKK